MEMPNTLKNISSMIKEYISRGLVPDNDTISFIKSAYGLSEPDEISSFIESGDDGGSVLDLVSYPSDSLRESIEELIPAEGFSVTDIKSIENTFNILYGKNFILLDDRKIILSQEDSRLCHKRILQRLNLDISLDYIADLKISSASFNIFTVRKLLRKKKFIQTDENSLFINDLIYNYISLNNNFKEEPHYCKKPGSSEFAELSDLINLSASLLSGSDKKPLEILSEKKYFYENSIIESEEFTQLLKTYSMEFIMMKKIHPPLLSADESRSMVRMIDRLTSIVYRMIIPSVRNIFMES